MYLKKTTPYNYITIDLQLGITNTYVTTHFQDMRFYCGISTISIRNSTHFHTYLKLHFPQIDF